MVVGIVVLSDVLMEVVVGMEVEIEVVVGMVVLSDVLMLVVVGIVVDTDVEVVVEEVEVEVLVEIEVVVGIVVNEVEIVVDVVADMSPCLTKLTKATISVVFAVVTAPTVVNMTPLTPDTFLSAVTFFSTVAVVGASLSCTKTIRLGLAPLAIFIKEVTFAASLAGVEAAEENSSCKSRKSTQVQLNWLQSLFAYQLGTSISGVKANL